MSFTWSYSALKEYINTTPPTADELSPRLVDFPDAQPYGGLPMPYKVFCKLNDSGLVASDQGVVLERDDFTGTVPITIEAFRAARCAEVPPPPPPPLIIISLFHYYFYYYMTHSCCCCSAPPPRRNEEPHWTQRDNCQELAGDQGAARALVRAQRPHRKVR